MSETKWTKGPWAVDPDDRPDMEWNNHIVVAAQPHLRICFMTHGDDEDENEANANLIAAAPDLAEALADMLGAHPPISKRIGGEGSPARRAQEDQEAAIAKARAALALALAEKGEGS